LRARGVEVRERGAGDAPARVGDLEVTPLWPLEPARADSRNDSSLVVRVVLIDGMRGEARAPRILLPGDLGGQGERALLASGAALGAEILKLGHHGSASSSSAEWLARVDPRIAIVSAPCMRRGGLPSPDALQRTRAQGAALWWTGRDGAVLVGLDAVGLDVVGLDVVGLDAPGVGLVARGWRERPACSSDPHPSASGPDG
jgi:competence protein ComEC